MVKVMWKAAVVGNFFLILLQEGRMRGQAFVTFPTVELAQRALVSDFVIDMIYCFVMLHGMTHC